MASEKQIPQVTGVILRHQDGLRALSDASAQWMIDNGRQAVDLIVRTINDKVRGFAEFGDGLKLKEEVAEPGFYGSSKVQF